MRTVTCLTLVCLLALLTPAHAQTSQTSLPITRVTLYTSGVGYFERSGEIDGDASQTLLFPVDQVNDILKSLVLLDTGGGQIRPVTYAAQDPVEKELQAFSIDISDNPDRATLLNRMRGAEVSVTYQTNAAPATITGTILGVETQTVTLPNSAGTTQQSTLNLFGEAGLTSLPLVSVIALKIDDPRLNDELNQALAAVAQGRDASKRPVTLQFSGNGRRRVVVGYVTQAPLWQTTYRLVLGKSPMLQGWALMQNTSQDDWNNVHLTLVSGRPISFVQDLYTPIYVPRPTVQTRIAMELAPQTYGSNLEAAPANAPEAASIEPEQRRFKATADVGGLGGIIANEQDNSLMIRGGPFAFAGGGSVPQSMAATGAQLGTALFQYAIDIPVTIPRQQSAMIPFLSAPVQAEKVAIFNVSVNPDHPLTGARIKNTSGLHLMGGPLTVFDDSGNVTGYVGDALIDDTEPNQTRLISYALDLGVDAQSEPGPGSGHVAMLTISQGVLYLTQAEETETDYTFKNNTQDAQTIVVEHPYQGAGWKLLAPEKAAERTSDVYRFDLPVPAGASKKLAVREEHPEEQSYELIDADLPTLVIYSRSGEASEEVKSALSEVISRRREMATTQQRILDIDSQIVAISQGQDRIRQNMKALDHSSALYKRYVSELNDQETRINSLQAQKDSQESELAQERQALNDYVSHLSIGGSSQRRDSNSSDNPPRPTVLPEGVSP